MAIPQQLNFFDCKDQHGVTGENSGISVLDGCKESNISIIKEKIVSPVKPNMSLQKHYPRNALRRQNTVNTMQKSLAKRRLTFPGVHDFKHPIRKRRRVCSMVLPTKFLLGGNIKDPLNLSSLEDEEVNRRMNAFTPKSSPLPLSEHRTQVQVLIPPNIYDPLNLNTGEEIEFNIISTKARKRKRHRRSFCRKDNFDSSKDSLLAEDEKQDAAVQDLEQTTIVESNKTSDAYVEFNKDLPVKSEGSEVKQPENLEIATSSVAEDGIAKHSQCEKARIQEKMKVNLSEKSTDEKVKVDKIVSPVVPQGLPKFYKRHHSRNVSADSEKVQQLKRDRSRYGRRKRKSSFRSDIQFRDSDAKYIHGSIPYCYKCSANDDPRLHLLSRSYFYGKDALDIGCNVGCVPMYIAEYFEPKSIVGIDVDANVIRMAWKHLRQHHNSSIESKEKFPVSMAFHYGPIMRLAMSFKDEGKTDCFPHNIRFCQDNYVLNSDEALQVQQCEYDVITCLRVTKWIHLNWGDEGLKRCFKRMYAQLRCGGILILEPQPWATYASKKQLSSTIYLNYNNIELRPEKFAAYLLSKEVGFTSCKLLGRLPENQKGYRQPVYLFTKGPSFSPPEDVHQAEMISPIVFNDIEWARCCEEDPESNCEWESNLMSSHNSPTDTLLQAGESSHYDMYSENQIFTDTEYFFPPECDESDNLYEQ